MRRARILVVDDEPRMLHAIARVLSGQHEVITTPLPREALTLAQGRSLDLAIVDVRMPELNGFELTARLKHASPGIDVILMTGSVSDADEKLVRAIREDAFYFIQKPFDREVLETLVGRCLERRRLAGANRRHVRRLETELAQARTFQRSLLPPASARLPGVTIDCRYEPCVELGGDFFDHAPVEPDGSAFLVADVSGHGVSAAMLTGIVKAAFRSTGGVGFEPLAVVERIAASVDAIGPERFVTLFAARVLGGGRRLEYVSAGHPSAILWGEGREPVSLASTGLIVTPAFPKAVRRKESVDLRPGDRLLVYTDGVTDAGSDEEQFGFERLLRHAVGSGAARGALLDDVVAEVRRFGEGRPQGDDWTLLLLGVE